MSESFVGRLLIMTAGPLVTIVTPAYNQADFLPETIESVLAQTYPNIEYIVIDDGSTDVTAEVLSSYADRLTVLRQANAGQSRTINRGVQLAQGKYVGYLSSDDLLHPRAIEALVEVLERDEATVCVFPDSDLIDPFSKIMKQGVCRPFDVADLLVKQECYIGPGALYRTEAARRVGGWRPELRLAPDREFWLRLSREGRFHFLEESLAGYRMHSNSTSVALVSEEQSREYLLVLDEFFANLSEASPLASRKSEAYGFANFLIARNCLRSGRFPRALAYYGAAIRLHGALMAPGYVFQLVKSAVSKPIRLLMSNLKVLA